jgi:15-cis-phytoene synthase
MLQLPKPQTTRKLADPEESYEFCRQITADYAKTFYLGTLLMTKKKRQAIWAIYAWCRRSDELVDGAKSQLTTPETLDLWEQQLESIFAGHPVDDTDVALVDSLERFPMDIQPFRDMIAGQGMDLYRSRYENFEQLKLYCYRVAGTVGLMSTAILGLDRGHLSVPWKDAVKDNAEEKAIALGIAMQLSNILRDVGEDAQRGRIYLPLEDLESFNYTEKDLLTGVNDDRWKALMHFQIQRARKYYKEAEIGVRYLCRDARWPVWSALMLYQGILDAIERNDYDVFNKRAYVAKPVKIASLPIAWLRAQAL